MAWSEGVFTRSNGVFSGSVVWVSDASAGIDILADRHDVHDQDLAAGINACLNRNGQNSPTANISWGGWKITAIGNGTVAADAAAFGQTITAFTFAESTRVLTGTRSAGNLTVTLPLPTETGHGLVPPMGVATGRVLTDSGTFGFLNASTINAGTLGVDRIPSLPPSKLSSGGATDAQVLVWSDFSGAFVPASPAAGGVVAWGSVAGALDDQLDLKAALDAKANLSDHVFTWSMVTANSNLVARALIIADNSTTTTHTLPASPSVGDVFGVNAKGANHRIASNGNVIDGVGVGNDLMVANGDTRILVVYGTNLLRKV